MNARVSLIAVGIAAWPLYAAAQAESASPREARRVAERVDAALAQMRVDHERAAQSARVTFSSAADRMERRLSEAEVQAALGDDLRAAVLLLDVVEDPELRTHPRRTEAMFRLAESLRRAYNDRAAWRYYEELAPRATGDRLDAIVEGMLEIAARTRRFEDIPRVLAYVPGGTTRGRPSADYAYGRALFRLRSGDPTRLVEALEVFRRIPAGTDITAKARYHAGATLVLLNRLPEAVAEFARVQDALGERGEPRLRDLTWLSLGRLHQELGETESAIEAYEQLEPESRFYSQMLYELAWAHVEAAKLAVDEAEARRQYRRALQATELLMATVPDATLYPRARILQGNLQIRLGAPETAYQTFESILDRYGRVRSDVTSFKVRRADTKAFFEQLVASELDRVDAPTVLPEVAIDYAREQDGLSRVVAIERDLAFSESNLEESREMIDVLTAALAGEQRYRMFPGLRATRDQMISIRGRALARDLELLEWERRLVFEHLTASQRAEADRAHSRVLELAGEIRELPQSAAEVESRRSDIASVYEETSLRAYKLTFRISGMRAQLVAIESWLGRNRDTLSVEEQRLMDDRVARTRAQVARLESELEGILQLLRAQRALAESQGTVGRVDRLQSEFDAARDAELDVLRQGRGALSTEALGVVSRYDQQRQRLSQIRQEVASLESRIDGQIRSRVAELQQAVAQEAIQLERLDTAYAGLDADVRTLIEPVADRTLDAVDAELEQLLMKADVGLIDVAWARKRAETERVDNMIRELQEQTQALEAEFADVLSE
jgi:tetratricopeptide (TPR) repeat protein